MSIRRGRRAWFLLGVVGVAVFGVSAASSLGGASGGNGDEQTIVIRAATTLWKDTGVEIGKGQRIGVAIVKNNATCHAGGATDCPIGYSAGYTCSNNPVVGKVPNGPGGEYMPYGLWIGRVGIDGRPFPIVSGTAPAGPGELYLAYNDCALPAGYSDNGGSATFRITGIQPKTCPVYFTPDPGDKVAVATVVVLKPKDRNATTEAAAWVQHGASGTREPLTEGYQLQAGDVITAGANAVLAFDFAAGGRVGVNAGAQIEVTGPRQVKDVSGNVSVKKADWSSAWAKCNKLKEPIEIQTNGGAMGSKG